MKRTALIALVLASGLPSISTGQWAGTNPETLLVTPAPQGVVVGTGGLGAALTVRGNQLSPATGLVFATYANTNVEHRWDMVKGTENIGRIFNPGSTGDKTFNMDARSDNLRFLTNSIYRSAIYYRVGDATINGQPGFNQSGYLTLTGAPNFITSNSSTGPFSRFHLVDGNGTNAGNSLTTVAPTLGFRGWMKNGFTITGNSDQMYFGHKYSTLDGAQQNGKSQAVVQWSEGTLDDDRQSLRFIFTTTPGAGTGAETSDGLEIMRLWPESNTSGYVGVGDFAGSAVNPLDRLVVLNGDVRIRDLPLAANEAPSFTKYVVVDPSTGELRWNNGPANSDCKWTMPSASPNHVSTAYGSASGSCPDGAEAVGIGVDLATDPNPPLGKLDLRTSQFATGISLQNNTTSGTTRGLDINTSGGSSNTRGIEITTTQSPGCTENKGIQINALSSGSICNWGNHNYGLNANVTGNSFRTHGVRSEVNGGTGGWSEYGGEFWSRGNASYTWGAACQVDGGTNIAAGVDGISNANALVNFGVKGGATGTTANTYYGVFGSASSSNTSANVFGGFFSATPNGTLNSTTGDWTGNTNWAVWSNGAQFSTTHEQWATSDARLKENIEPLTGSLKAIVALEPKTFTYNRSLHPTFNLPLGEHYGLISQEVEKVLPSLVMDTQYPNQYNAEGKVVDAGFEFKAMSYTGLIPVLVGAVKEQQEIIDDKQAQIDALAARLGVLEAALNGEVKSGRGIPANGSNVGKQLTIAPNPFGDRTTITYLVNCDCRVQLDVTTADGKPMTTLVNDKRSSGTYTYAWDTTSIASGTYYCTLIVDGMPTVKQAIKVAR